MTYVRIYLTDGTQFDAVGSLQDFMGFVTRRARGTGESFIRVRALDANGDSLGPRVVNLDQVACVDQLPHGS